MYIKPVTDIIEKKDIKFMKSTINDIMKIIDGYKKAYVLENEYLDIQENEVLKTFIDFGFIKKNNDADQFNNFLGKNKEKFYSCFKLYISIKQADLLYDEDDVLLKYSSKKRTELQSKNKEKTPKIIDLFCGSGGLSLGFTKAGFNVRLANDIEEVCTRTYSLNHPEVPSDRIRCGDIIEVVDHINDLLNGEKIDVVVGGPPCQSFSMANRQRIIDDPRNILYKYFVKAVNFVRPQYFVMENVKGMKPVADQVVQDFEAIGYNTVFCILNAKNFSVPQNRERLFFIGTISDTDPSDIFVEIINQKNNNYVLKDAISDLKELKAFRMKNATEIDSDESGYKVDVKGELVKSEYLSLINTINSPLIFNHKARYNNDRDIEIYGRMHQGDKSDSHRIADIMPYGNRSHIFKDKYFRLVENNISKTITAHMKFDCNMYIHPTQARGLTPREAARVQSYPDDYFFTGPYTKTYMQIGNSVPPLMAKNIADVLLKYINKQG